MDELEQDALIQAARHTMKATRLLALDDHEAAAAAVGVAAEWARLAGISQDDGHDTTAGARPA